MDLIYTNARRIDQGAMRAYAFDLSFGADENDFELILDAAESVLEYGAFTYIEGTEYGGVVDGIKASTVSDTVTYFGRTWHGFLNSYIIAPDAGKSHLTVNGDANDVLAFLIDRLGLGALFAVEDKASGIFISNYQFPRYCKGYDGILAMLSKVGAKLKITWSERRVILSVKHIVDYSALPIDGHVAPLTVKKYKNKVNHLICLGRGEMAEREIIHLYVDQFGRIGTVQYYTGLEEYTDTYENINAETTEELLTDAQERFRKLRDLDSAEISINEDAEKVFDIGDIVGATETRTGVSVATAVAQKIVRIKNGAVSIEYQAGG